MLWLLILLFKINLAEYRSKRAFRASDPDAAQNNEWREIRPFGRIL